LEKKTNDLNKIIENDRIEPATPVYITIKQICDVAKHFPVERRADKGVKINSCYSFKGGELLLTSRTIYQASLNL
jgi:hypothetical protein